MKRSLFYTVALIGIIVASCKKAPQQLSSEQFRKKADSLVSIRVRISDENAHRDLERRIKIEVKVKADSILDKKLHPNVKDTLATARKRTNLFAQPQ